MMSMQKSVSLLMLVCLITATHQTGGGGAPGGVPEPWSKDDPRCKSWNSDTDTREFDLIGMDFWSEGLYDCDIEVTDDGKFTGQARNLASMDPACPVMVSLSKQTESGMVPVAGGSDNLQGVFDKFASVVANINCCLADKVELPFPKHDNYIKVEECYIFPRHFPAGFEPGEYLVEVNHTCSPALGEGYDGGMFVKLELKKIEE